MKRLSTVAIVATVAVAGFAAVAQSTVLGDVPNIDAHAAALAPSMLGAIGARPAGAVR